MQRFLPGTAWPRESFQPRTRGFLPGTDLPSQGRDMFVRRRLGQEKHCAHAQSVAVAPVTPGSTAMAVSHLVAHPEQVSDEALGDTIAALQRLQGRRKGGGKRRRRRKGELSGKCFQGCLLGAAWPSRKTSLPGTAWPSRETSLPGDRDRQGQTETDRDRQRQTESNQGTAPRMRRVRRDK